MPGQGLGQLLRQFLKGIAAGGFFLHGGSFGRRLFAARRQGCVQFMQERLGAFRCGLVPQLHGKTGGRLRGRRGLRLHRIVWGHDRLAHGFRFAAGGRPSERHGAFPLLAGGELHGIPLFIFAVNIGLRFRLRGRLILRKQRFACGGKLGSLPPGDGKPCVGSGQAGHLARFLCFRLLPGLFRNLPVFYRGWLALIRVIGFQLVIDIVLFAAEQAGKKAFFLCSVVAGRLLLAQFHLVRFILQPGQLFFQLLGALVFHPAADRNIDRLKLPGIGSISKAKQALFLRGLLALLLGLHIIRNNGHAGAKKVGKIFFSFIQVLAVRFRHPAAQKGFNDAGAGGIP